MRSRFWLFCLLVAAALAVNLAVASRRLAQDAEEGLGSRLTVASAGLRTQVDLLDLRISPRTAAFSPELIEATKPSADALQQPARPDERALRAATAALQPDPDLIVVATAHSAAVSRRGKAASVGEEPARLPLVRIALEGGAAPQFVPFEGKLYRTAAARIPGNAAVVLTGTLIDDKFASQLRSALDADVSFVQQGAVVASSLPQEERAPVGAWAKAPAGSGFGTVRVSLPLVGTRFADQLPLGPPRAATRAVLVPLAQGTQAVVSLPAAPQLAWLARYQAFYAAAWAVFLLAALVWGAFLGAAPRAQAEARPEPVRARRQAERKEASASQSEELLGTDLSARSGPVAETRAAPSDAPWTEEAVSPPVRRAPVARESLDPDVPPPQRDDEPQLGPLTAATGTDPVWSGDPFGAPGSVQGADPSGEMELAARPGATGEEQRSEAASPALGAGWSEPPPADGGAAPGGWGAADPGAAEPWPPPASEPEPEPEPAPEPAARPTNPAGDPDEAHFRETFDKFMALRAETGEAGTLSYEKFAAKLRQNREQLLSRGTARTVRFTVYKKDGRAAIKASALR